MIPDPWPGLAAIAYSSAALLFALHLADRGPRILRASRGPAAVLGIVGLAAHTLALQALLFVPGGLDLGLFQVASLVAWQIALLVLVAATHMPVAGLAVLALPIAAVFAFLPSVFTSSSILPELGWRLEAHILLSLLAYSLLALAAVQALVLAVQDRHLRQRRPGGWVRALPALETMEILLFRLIGAGFILLGLALFTGILFVDNLFAQHLVHKTVLSVLAWALFGVLLWGRWRHGWRGPTALRWTLGAFLVLALAYFGSKVVLELILGRRWG